MLLFALLDIVLAVAGAVSNVNSYRAVGVGVLGWMWVWVGVESVLLFALLDIVLAMAGAVSHVNSYRAVDVDVGVGVERGLMVTVMMFVCLFVVLGGIVLFCLCSNVFRLCVCVCVSVCV